MIVGNIDRTVDGRWSRQAVAGRWRGQSLPLTYQFLRRNPCISIEYFTFMYEKLRKYYLCKWLTLGPAQEEMTTNEEHKRTTIKIDIVHASIKDHDRIERILTNQDRVPPVTVGHSCGTLFHFGLSRDMWCIPSLQNDRESSVHATLNIFFEDIFSHIKYCEIATCFVVQLHSFVVHSTNWNH